MQIESAVRSAEQPFLVENRTLLARDDFALGATLVQPKSQPIGTVIVHGATAVPSGFYRRYARFLAHHGMRVLTYDYRGVGRSRPSALRGFQASMTDWAKLDAAAAHKLVREQFPHEPVATVGHSFGGQLIGLLDEAREVSGGIVVGSQLAYYKLWGSRDAWGSLERLRLGLMWRALVPTITASLGYLPGQMGIGEDLPRGVAEEWAKWCSSPDYLISHEPHAAQRFASFEKPMLFYSFSDDDFAPERATQALLARLSAAQLTRRHIHPHHFGGAPIGHFGFFKQRFEQSLWLETVHFLQRVFGS